MALANLEKIFQNEPAYRKKQVFKAVFDQLIENWDEATALSKPRREKLKKVFPLQTPTSLQETKDKQTQKALLTLEDSEKIETVLMRHQKRKTICVSTQVGCPLGCAFCATGKMGFTRNLTDWEIVQQVLFFARLLKKEGQKITNLVYMGMGEPMLNYDHVLSSIKTLHTEMNLGARRFSISTAGIPEGIDKLAEEKMEIN
ncbi:radical SAM protein, partial [Patescibacteria group bacterium]|nr:radical SAM protein [Patescibacteria group bacterium]